MSVLETQCRIPVAARTSHRITTAQDARSTQWQRPKLRIAISPTVFAHRRLKVMGWPAGLETPDAVTHTWQAQ